MNGLMNGLATRSADIVKILLIVGIAYTLATTAWHFVSGPVQSAEQQPVAGIQRSGSGTTAAVDIQRIIGANIFGDVSAAPVEEKVVQPTNQPAKETRLPLTLLGVFKAEHPEDSAAIVAQKGKAGLRYAIGQTMPGNAELVEVYSDYIILRRAGVRETLRFPKSDKMISSVDATSSSRGASSRTGNPAPRAARSAKITPPNRRGASSNRQLPTSTKELVAQYRDKLSEDPAGTLNSIGVTPVAAGDAQGYKLGQLASSPYLRNTGLQSGDVLLSVNGQAVGDIQLDQLRINNVLSEGSARLEIMRGSRRFFVTAALQ